MCVAVCSQPSYNSLCVEPPLSEEAITTFTKQRVMPVLHQVQHYRDALKHFRYGTIITVLAVVNISVCVCVRGGGMCICVYSVCVHVLCMHVSVVFVCFCVCFVCFDMLQIIKATTEEFHIIWAFHN